MTGVSCGLCGSTAISRSSVLGIPEDLSHQTFVFVNSEMWPRNLAENVTLMVTGTVSLGVLYVPEIRPVPTACYLVLATKHFVELSLNSVQVVEHWWIPRTSIQCQPYSIYGRKWVSAPTFQIYVPVWAQLHTYIHTYIPNPPKPTIQYDFPTLYFPLKACLLTGVNKICLVFFTFLNQIREK